MKFLRTKWPWFFLCALSILACVGNASAQNGLKKLLTPGWYEVDSSLRLKAIQFFTRFSQELSIQPLTNMRQQSVRTSAGGISHYRFQQFYNGIEVVGGEFLVHEKGGGVYAANGDIKQVNATSLPRTSFEAALAVAKTQVRFKQFAWENRQAEAQLKEFKKTQTATYYPQKEMAYVEDATNTIQLCYAIRLYDYNAVEGKLIYVNAITGRPESVLPITYNCVATTVTTSTYGQRTVTIQKTTSPSVLWKTIDDCQAAVITVRDWNNGTPTVYEQANPANFPTSPLTSLWTAKQVYNFYKNIFNRNSWNNDDANITINQNAIINGGYDNASFNPSNSIFSVGNAQGPTEASNTFTGDDRNTLHTLGHELTHGVTSSECNLKYEKESGGLNESFSDIFGVAVYQWVFGNVWYLWQYGYDRTDINGNHLVVRRMDDPYLSNQPKFYGGLNWVSTTAATDPGDGWGVHTNSGVQNYFFHLLTAGGSGVNEAGKAFNILGIGMTAARTIAYDVLTNNRLTTTSKYVDARAGWIQAAREIYGPCSNQAIQVAKAWDAVGVYCPTSSPNYNVAMCNANYIYGPGFISAYNNLTAAGTGCTVTVNNTSTGMVYAAGSAVILKPGFVALQGSGFTATVTNECALLAY